MFECSNRGTMIKRFANKFLKFIEIGGNALPHPATLFAIMAVLVVIGSGIVSLFDVSVLHPGTGETIKPVNLMSVAGLHWIILNLVGNFAGFAPLGTVIVSLLGIGIAESSGLMSAGLRLLILKAPERLLTFVVVFAGVLSNMASEIGYVVLIPLGAMIFLAVGRHPIAGLAAAFAGVSGGYSANLLLGTVDPLLSGISTEAAQIINAAYEVSPAANYYFMFVSTFFIAGAGTWVTEKIVIPNLGLYKGDAKPEKLEGLTALEKRGLKFATVAIIILTGIILLGSLPEHGFLRSLETTDFLKSPFLKGIVAFIFVGGATAGIAYGIGAKTIKNDTDVMNGMAKQMETLALYIVLVFFAAQFVAYFNYTQLGLIIAVEGAGLLESSGLGPIPLMIAFVIISGFLNMFMGSASAKWAIMAPVFIPMFMILGFSPEFTQVTYRIGDSVTNIISPMMSYFALIIAFMQKYDRKAGLGTLVSTMLPYTIAFFIIWTILLVIWILFEIPVGPGAGIYYVP